MGDGSLHDSDRHKTKRTLTPPGVKDNTLKCVSNRYHMIFTIACVDAQFLHLPVDSRCCHCHKFVHSKANGQLKIQGVQFWGSLGLASSCFVHLCSKFVIGFSFIMHHSSLVLVVALSTLVAVSRGVSRPHRMTFNSNQDLEPCTAENCKLPDCFCSGTVPPGGLTADQVPQIVMLTFDDQVDANFYQYQSAILGGQYVNPNGCPMTATFFVKHQDSDYFLVNELYSKGNEIADHSITHRSPPSWWANASETEWQNEVGGQRTILELFGLVNASKVAGFRAPFLQTGDDQEFTALQSLDFLYESSMPTCDFIDPPLYPYTLDFARKQECMLPPCPEASHPGIWEVPLVGLTARRTGKICYSMVDSYVAVSQEDAYLYLRDNFDRHYKGNRAPYGIFMHANWFLQQPNISFPALEKLLGELTAMKDVWLLSVSQMLAWMRNPQSMETAPGFEPWKCPPIKPACQESEANNCHYNSSMMLCDEYVGASKPSRQSLCGTDDEQVMRTCAACPPHYPWYGNPAGK